MPTHALTILRWKGQPARNRMELQFQLLIHYSTATCKSFKRRASLTCYDGGDGGANTIWGQMMMRLKISRWKMDHNL
jgi:hypothetical protein